MNRPGFAVCAAAFVGFTLAVWRFRGAGDAAWYVVFTAAGIAWIFVVEPRIVALLERRVRW